MDGGNGERKRCRLLLRGSCSSVYYALYQIRLFTFIFCFFPSLDRFWLPLFSLSLFFSFSCLGTWFALHLAENHSYDIKIGKNFNKVHWNVHDQLKYNQINFISIAYRTCIKLFGYFHNTNPCFFIKVHY